MKSMTGYGKGEAANETRKVTIEIKAVNNRFLDINTRFPKSLSYVEDGVKKQIQEVVKRGTLDVYYTYEVTGETDKVVAADLYLAEQYLSAMKQVRDGLGTADDITTMAVIRMPDVLTVTAAEEDRDEIKELYKDAETGLYPALYQWTITGTKNDSQWMQDSLGKKEVTIPYSAFSGDMVSAFFRSDMVVGE